MNTTRHQQLLSLIKRILSTELQQINHELFHAVVVTDVLLSNDGRECRVWVQSPNSIIDLMNSRYKGEIHHAFMKQYPRKYIPRLTFLPDQGDISHVEELLEKVDNADE